MRTPPEKTRREFLSRTTAASAAAWLSTFIGRPVRADDIRPSTHTPIENQLAQLRDIDAGKPRKRVTILGAGMAGLCAAYELKRLGHRVTIFEGSDRVGGRVWTKRFPKLDGHEEQYHELGAMRIPASHDHTRHYIREMNLKLRPFVTSHDNRSAFYDFSIDGRRFRERIEDAPRKLIPKFRLSHLERAQAQTMAAPVIFGNRLADLIDALTKEDIAALFGPGARITPRIKEFDKLTLGDFLRDTTTGKDALALVGAATGLKDWFEEKSLGMFLRDEIIGAGEGLQEIVGGTDKLPEEIAKKLGFKKHLDDPDGVILLNAEVTEIMKDQEGGKVKLTVKIREKAPDGEHRPPEAPKLPIARTTTRLCDAVLCTLPFPLLEGSTNAEHVKEKVRHNFSDEKRAAIANLSYTSSTKVLLHCRRRFWEEDDGIFGGASQSDQITRATYYPSDNVRIIKRTQPDAAAMDRLVRSMEGEQPGVSAADMLPIYHRRLRGSYTGPASRLNTPNNPNESAAMVSVTPEKEYQAKSPAVSKGPGVLVGSYSWGESARTMGEKSKEERKEAVVEVLSQFHRGLKEPGIVLHHESIAWDKHPWAGRAFCFLQPEDHPKYFDAAVRPEGNVFFAGEHCSLVQAWIQGAIISALDAVKEILKT